MVLQWLLGQWNDIKGNAKWAVVLVGLSAMVAAAIALTHGLALWQQLILAVLFIVIFGWAVFMSAAYSLARGNLQPAPPRHTEATGSVLIGAPTEVAPWLRPMSLEQRDFNALRHEFEALTWSQQVALAMLCNSTTLSASTLIQLLGQRGFGADIKETIITPLIRTRFVELSSSGQMSPHPARLSAITQLIEQWRSRP
jgi:hypothetical protein